MTKKRYVIQVNNDIIPNVSNVNKQAEQYEEVQF